MNYKRVLIRKFMKKRDKFTAQHEFKDAKDLLFSREEIADLVEFHKIISVEISGERMFPTFQFDSSGRIYEVLQALLPRLLECRSSWDICFWLYEEQAVVMHDVKIDAALLENMSLDEVLRLGAVEDGLVEIYTAKPIELITTGNKETFAAFIEDWLNPDSRVLPQKKLYWYSFFDDLSNKLSDDFSRD